MAGKGTDSTKRILAMREARERAYGPSYSSDKLRDFLHRDAYGCQNCKRSARNCECFNVPEPILPCEHCGLYECTLFAEVDDAVVRGIEDVASERLEAARAAKQRMRDNMAGDREVAEMFEQEKNEREGNLGYRDSAGTAEPEKLYHVVEQHPYTQVHSFFSWAEVEQFIQTKHFTARYADQKSKPLIVEGRIQTIELQTVYQPVFKAVL